MLNEIKKRLPAHEVIPITRETFTQVWDVYATNEEFFMITEGRMVTMDSSVADTETIPPGYDASQKLYLGIFDEVSGKPMAVMDLLHGYPDGNCVWIGLLLVHGDYKRKRVGSILTEAVCEAATAKGSTSVQLGVVAANEAALIFWESCGFRELRKATANIAGHNKTDIVVMEKRLR
jgi:GNAT superfamily N-acetyltransferase